MLADDELMLLLAEPAAEDVALDVDVPATDVCFVPADRDDDGGLLLAAAAKVEEISCDDDVLVVSAPVLSGAFGWPPSSGDGAILERVKRTKIISEYKRSFFYALLFAAGNVAISLLFACFFFFTARLREYYTRRCSVLSKFSH